MKLIRHSDEHFFFYFPINLLKLWQYFIQQLLTIRVAPETIFLKYSALNLVYISLRSGDSRHFTTPPLVCPRNDFSGTTADIPYWWRVTTQIRIRVLIGWKFDLSNQKHNTDLVVAFISMEFLRSFPRRHFEGKPMIAWRNFGCFLRLRLH